MATATQAATPSTGAENFAALFEESLARQEMRQGELITAEVIRVDYNIVVVNAGLKSESFIPIEEFRDDKGEVEVKPGDFVTVAIESLENGYGETRLSRDKAKRLKAWHDLEASMEQGSVVQGLVTSKVKGGLTVMINGIRAFLPGSLVDIRPVKDTSPYEGKQLDFQVIKLDRKRNNVVVSRRAVLEESLGEEREKLLATLSEGAIVKGIVKNITDYGAFVDLGGIDGLLHITDLAWRRVKHPSEVLSVGDEVEAEPQRVGQHPGEPADAETDLQDALFAGALHHGVDDALRHSQLVHRGSHPPWSAGQATLGRDTGGHQTQACGALPSRTGVRIAIGITRCALAW